MSHHMYLASRASHRHTTHLGPQPVLPHARPPRRLILADEIDDEHLGCQPRRGCLVTSVASARQVGAQLHLSPGKRFVVDVPGPEGEHPAWKATMSQGSKH
jgi:hypothetical protein